MHELTQSYLDQVLGSDKEAREFRHFFLTARDKKAVLRKLAQESMERFKDTKPFSNFEAVGAIKLNYDDWYGLDAHRIYDMFTYALKTGIPINPDYSVHASNLLYDEDYLKTESTADAVLISYVPLLTDAKDENIYGGTQHDTFLTYVDLKRPQVEFLRAKHEFAQGTNPKSGSYMAANRMVSDLNRVSNWIERLAKSKAKLIFSIYEYQEVDLRLVMPENYIALGDVAATRDFDETRLSDVSHVQQTAWQVIGSHEFVEYMENKVRTHVTPYSGIKHTDPALIGTQLGTNIVNAAEFLLNQKLMQAQLNEAANRPKTLPQKPAPKPDDKKI